MPNFSLGLPAYYVLATSEASSNLARYDGVRYPTHVQPKVNTSQACEVNRVRPYLLSRELFVLSCEFERPLHCELF